MTRGPGWADRCPRCGYHASESGSHPLTRVRVQYGLSLLKLAKAVAQQAAAMGIPNMAAERQKVWRWENRGVTPDNESQAALACLLGVDAGVVVERGWPGWLETVAPPRPGVSLEKAAAR